MEITINPCFQSKFKSLNDHKKSLWPESMFLLFISFQTNQLSHHEWRSVILNHSKAKTVSNNFMVTLYPVWTIFIEKNLFSSNPPSKKNENISLGEKIFRSNFPMHSNQAKRYFKIEVVQLGDL